MNHDETIYVLTLRALPDAVPADVRMARALKLLLRAYRLRNLGLRTLPRVMTGDDVAGRAEPIPPPP